MNFKVNILESPRPRAGGACVLELVPEPGARLPAAVTIRVPRDANEDVPKFCLDLGRGPQPLAAADDRASRVTMLERSIAAGLNVSPESLGGPESFDRCLIGLMIVGRDKAMSLGRLAYLVSDLFDDISVNRVRERLAAIKDHFQKQGIGGLIVGDQTTGFRIGH